MQHRMRIGVARPGLLLAMMAVAAQILLGGLLPLRGVMLAGQERLASLGAICHAGDDGREQTPGPPHGTDCVLCPLCLSIAATGLVSSTAPPPPTTFHPARAGLPPPVRAPPAEPLRIAYPRGPPALA